MTRIFTADDQLSFASLSGDYNPMHVDPVAARRFLFGRPVVHGVHGVLWAIDTFLAQRVELGATPLLIRTLTADFHGPIIVNEPVELSIGSAAAEPVRLELSSVGVCLATVNVAIGPSGVSRMPVPVLPRLPGKGVCREPSAQEAELSSGELALHLDAPLACRLFPNACRSLPHEQLAALLATTRLVGMEMPGLHSLYTGLDLATSDELKDPVLVYVTERHDPQFAMLLNLRVKAPGLSGRISAAFRPKPTDQADMTGVRRLVKVDEFHGERALVIGGSRGLGEVAVKQLAAGGAEVRFSYHKGAADAQRILADIAQVGGTAACFPYDAIHDAIRLRDLLAGWSPTMLCYFATPFIATGVSGRFSPELFRTFCSHYVDGFLAAFRALGDGEDLTHVLTPSSTFVEEVPPNMGEYAAAKSASETLCAFLAKAHKGVTFHYPRFPRLATDQTASLFRTDTDPQPVILEALRRMRLPKTEAPPERTEARSTAEVGSPFAVAATFTAEPVEGTLRFWMKHWGGGPVRFAPYNQVFHALLDRSLVLDGENFANAVLVRLEDWVEGDGSSLDADGWKRRLEPIVVEFLSAARATTGPAPTLVVVCPPSLPLAADGPIAAVLDEMATRIVDGLTGVPGVFAFGHLAVSSIYSVIDYYDAGADALGNIPYTPRYFAALGTFLARMAHAARRASYKVIVLDCDDTLWAGVCGEGGPAAVTVTAGHRALQNFVIAQAAAGKVLCVCSKNVESDVFDVFDRHAGMVLKRDQIAGWRINWSPKSRNLQELAVELNLGLESFIFLDDNPVECAEMRANCPEVLTLQAPADAADWPDFLRGVWAFDQLVVTEQDRRRAASYVQNARREAVRRESSGLDDFLSKLQLEVNITSSTPAQLQRVAQLTERTNQFNASTIRRSESEILELLRDPGHQCNVVEVKDRFGDYGLVGVLISRAEELTLVVDTLLLSCRVLGRGVEHRMIAAVGRHAVSAGLPTVQVPFVRSKKNQPALDFLDSVAADYRAQTADGFVYRIPAGAASVVRARAVGPSPGESNERETAPAGTDEAAATGTLPYERIATELRDAGAILSAVEDNSRATRRVNPLASVEPRNNRQRELARIWCSVLDLPRVGIHDDYFDLGGTSLLAVRVVLEIEKSFGRRLPIAALLKAPTIERLAAQLDLPGEADDLAAITLVAEGDNPPLFLLPGIGGHVMFYRRMAALLDTHQPVYGLEMRPEVEANRVPRPMEQIAAEFLERVLTLQPDEPYFLAGYSFGGGLTFEIARQLQRQGRRVAFCALFDTFCHGYPRVMSHSERIWAHAREFHRRSAAQNVAYIISTAGVQARAAAHRLLRLFGVRKTDFYAYPSPELEQMVKVCDDAWNAYKPGPLSGNLTLVRGRHRPERLGLSYDDPYNGWGPWAPDGVTVVSVDSDHMTLFESPVVGQVAAALSASIRGTLAKSPA